MLQDRPYMHDSFDRNRTSVLTWLISTVVAVYLVQTILAYVAPGTGYWLESALGLSSAALKSGHLWTLVTYGFLHDPGNLLLVITYLLAIYFVGRELLPIMGSRRFLGFYAAALATGGLAWTAVHWGHSGVMLGSASAVWALTILYACFYPNREVTLVLFFVLPVTFKPKHLAYVLIGIDVLGFVFYELVGAASPFGVATHSAHLGGMAVGWIYFRYLHEAVFTSGRERTEIELPRWMKQRDAGKSAAPAPAYTVNIAGRGHLRAEVDRILDKINSDGFGALSAEEKKLLDEARDLIGRR
jgi:membrane associated rhomboid family serine protease